MIIDEKWRACDYRDCKGIAEPGIDFCSGHAVAGRLRKRLWALDINHEFQIDDVRLQETTGKVKVSFVLKHIEGLPKSECFREWTKNFLIEVDVSLNTLIDQMLLEELAVAKRSL